MILTQNAKALAQGISTYFMAIGGTEPYTYSVLAGGSGGSINSGNGLYVASGNLGMDTIRVTDSNIIPVEVDLTIAILSPIELLCDIIQTQMGLSDGQVSLYDQKINIPITSGLFISVGVLACKPFSNTNKFDGTNDIQSTNFSATISIDIFSRNLEALNRKEEIIMALNSSYSQKQQEANSFYLAKNSTAFVNISYEEGVSMLYRFNITTQMQYSITKKVAPEYYDNFDNFSLLTNE